MAGLLIMGTDVVQELLNAIESALNGFEDSDLLKRVIEKYDYDLLHDKLLGDACSELAHFMTDADIRKTDAKYDLYIRTRLKTYVLKINDRNKR